MLKVSFSMQKRPISAIFCLVFLIVVYDALFERSLTLHFLDLPKKPNDTTIRNFCVNHTIRSVRKEKKKPTVDYFPQPAVC